MTEKILGLAVFVILAITLIFFSLSSFLLGDRKAHAQQPPTKLELGARAMDYFAFVAQEVTWY